MICFVAYLSICLFMCLLVCLFACLFVCLFGWLVGWLVGCLIVCVLLVVNLFVVCCVLLVFFNAADDSKRQARTRHHMPPLVPSKKASLNDAAPAALPCAIGGPARSRHRTPIRTPYQAPAHDTTLSKVDFIYVVMPLPRTPSGRAECT